MGIVCSSIRSIYALYPTPSLALGPHLSDHEEEDLVSKETGEVKERGHQGKEEPPGGGD